MPLRAIIFDMDGTLGNTIPFIIQALQETFHRYDGRDYNQEEIYAMFGPTEEGVILPRIPGPRGEEALSFFLDRYAVLHETAPHPFPGAIELLKFLKTRKIKTGIVTGKGPKTAFISMQAFGLEPYVDALAPGSYGGADKPEGIRRMLSGWQIPPDQAAYVGDTAYDMQAAREAGVLPLAAVWAETAVIDPVEPHQFRSIADLQRWLEQNL